MLLHPKFFGPDLQMQLKRKLYEDVEGKFDRRFGVIVAVKDVVSIDRGKIVEGKGFASFRVRYRAVVYRLFKNEIIDALVTQVSPVGFFATAGPITVLIHNIVSAQSVAPPPPPPPGVSSRPSPSFSSSSSSEIAHPLRVCVRGNDHATQLSVWK